MNALQCVRISFEVIAEQARMPRRLARQKLDTLLRDLTPADRPTRRPSWGLERALDAADIVAARIPRMPRTCLYRSLSRYAVLRRAGIPVRFVMGLPSGALDDGHAWLELDGVPFRESRRACVVTFSYPPADLDDVPR